MAHFDGTAPGCNIHTTRSTGPCPNAGAGAGHCKYRENSNSLAHDPWNAHHLLPVHSVSAYATDATYSAYTSEIDDCYKLTSWCINQPANMIGLPLKSTHQAYSVIRALNLPAHNLDHNCNDGYTQEVEDEIADKIWSKIKKAVDDAKTNKAHFTPAQVQAQFKSLETHFRTQLAARGARSLGTAVAWSNKGSTTNGWWLAFSMAKTTVAMGRPIATL